METKELRIFPTELLKKALEEGIPKALKRIDERTVKLLERAETNSDGLEKWALEQILRNTQVAKDCDCYACQDTGLAVVFLDVGRDVHFDGDPYKAINEGVRGGYADARKSVADPLSRINTRDNTPAIVHTSIVSGNKVRLSYLAKGAGSENMSSIRMLTPSKGRQGIITAVTDAVAAAGANPCPPIILGVGVGGTFEKCALMSKRALLRPTGEPSPDPETAELERDILKAVNSLGFGAQGFKGKNCALSVAVETFPTHIGMLPVAVNIQCHSVRHFSTEL